MRDNGSLVAKAAEALTAMSLRAAAGTHLGGEDELIEALGVSRPTLRQAAKIVESDRLITVRRGMRGGFYATRPDAADVIRAPARYLRIEGATLEQVHVVTRLVGEEAAAAASGCDNDGLRQRLEEFRDHIGDADTVAAMIAADVELARLLATMSGNPATQLIIEIGYTFGQDERKIRFYRDPADRRQARELQRAVCDAVLSGDADISRLMMQRRAAMISAWLRRDHEACAMPAGSIT